MPHPDADLESEKPHDETTERDYDFKVLEFEELCRIAIATEEHWADTHNEYRADLAFSYGEQWEDDEVQKREDMGLPCEVFNICDSFIKPMVNAVRKSPPDVTIHPVSKVTKQNAMLLSGVCRSISYASNATRTYTQALEQIARGGLGAWKTLPEKIGDRTVIRVKAIPDPTNVMPDPHAEQPDFSDAEYFLNRCFYKLDTAQQLFPEYYANKEETHDTVAQITEEVCIYDLWIRQTRISDGSEIIVQYRFDPNDDTIEIDDTWAGKRIPFVFLTGEPAFYDGRMHYRGIIRPIRHVQRHVNFIESEAIAVVGNRVKAKFLMDEDAIKGHEEAYNQCTTKAQSVLYHKKGANIQVIDQAVAATALYEASRAAMDMAKQITGIINDPGQQMQVSEQSGKAIALQQSQAAISTYNFIETLEYGLKLQGEILLDQIKHWLNNDDVIESMGVDQKFVPVSIGPNIVPDVANIDLDYGEYGVSVSSGASYATQKDELVNKVFELCAKDNQLFGLIGDWLFNTMDIEGSAELAGRFRAVLPKPVLDYINAQESIGDQDPAEVLPQVITALNTAQQQIAQMQEMGNDLIAKLKQAEDRNQQELALAREKIALESEARIREIVLKQQADTQTKQAGFEHEYALNLHKEQANINLKMLDSKVDAVLELIKSVLKVSPEQIADVDVVKTVENMI